jgi:hypothetical protein
MGLMIRSVGELPTHVERDYYVYLLDYGWEEPVSEAMYRNFPRMADAASQNNAVVFRGIVGAHFADEVLSWHHINGRDSADLLPAILITTKHPSEFRENHWSRRDLADRLLLIPLRRLCKSPSDVAPLIQGIFKDIQEKNALSQFEIAEEMRAGRRGALVDALILKPNFVGLGLDINHIIDFFRGRKNS